ncbi:MAG: ATP-binding protein [Candidatus Krumholzibacteriia bacterium]
MDQSAPEALTFGLSTRALAELKGLAPAEGDRLRLALAGDEPVLAPDDPGERLCALLVAAERGGEIPPALVAAMREHLDAGRYLIALSSRGGAGSEEGPRPVAEETGAFREFLDRWRFERIFRTAPQLAGYGRATLELTIPSEETLIPGLSHTVGLLLREFGFAQDDWMSTVPLVLDEVLTNAMRHGNQGAPEKCVRVSIAIEADALHVTVTDEGEGFRREGVADPRQGDRIWRAGGRGLFLIEQLMDEVSYRDEGRTVHLVKHNRAVSSPCPG